MLGASDFDKVSAILSVFEELHLNTNNLYEEVESGLSTLPVGENLALARAYMASGRPRTTSVLRRAVEVELMFLSGESLLLELQGHNPAPLERCLLSEIKERRHEFKNKDVRDALLYFDNNKIRKEFLLWAVGNYHLDLIDLLLMRQFVLYPHPMSWSGEVSQEVELGMVDESIRLTLCIAKESNIQRAVFAFKKNKITKHILPSFFIPLIVKIHPNVRIG